jgi:hypothetical protein
MELAPDQAANAVERHGCPQCVVPAGSPCRTRGGKTTIKYHTARFILVPALKEELDVVVPADRGPGRPWKQGPPVQAVRQENAGTSIRIGYARTSTIRQELTPGGCSMYWYVSLTEPDNPVLLFDADGWNPREEQGPEHGVTYVIASLRRWLWTWANGHSVWDEVLAR